MPNVAKVLREEISRIARKEAKIAVSPVRRPSVRLRKEVANLRRRMSLVEKDTRQLQVLLRKMAAAQPATVPHEREERVRITAKGMRSLRRKLGFSRAKFAALLGVSSQMVYNWEKAEGALRLREKTKASLLSIRGLGVKDAERRLAETKPEKVASKRRTRRKRAR
jgi:DNA-binding transcriptional regulator YiaG